MIDFPKAGHWDVDLHYTMDAQGRFVPAGDLKVKNRSSIKNCTLVRKHDDKSRFNFEFPDKPEAGACYVNLDGYLICPVEMFTPRQLKAAMKKYHTAHSRT